MKKIVTKELLVQLLTTKDPSQVIGRALVGIFQFQTEAEKSNNDVEVWNGIGFTGADGRSGSLTAKYFLKHGRLEQWQIDRWMKVSDKTQMPRICKYHKQLNVIANAKLLKQA